MNCPECRAIMEGGVIDRCTQCPRKWPMSIAEVKQDYPGALMCEIIEERSSGGIGERGTDFVDGSADGSGAPCAGECVEVPGREAVAQEEAQ